MKPSVIPNENSSEGENSSGMNINNSNSYHDPTHYPPGYATPNAPRGGQFPHYEGEYFPEAAIRSRLPPRMRDPFSSFGAHDADNFFDGFGSRRNPASESAFFNNLPQEFRQYIPEGFGFPAHRRSDRGNLSSPSSTRPQPQYQQHPPQHPQQHPQQHRQYPLGHPYNEQYDEYQQQPQQFQYYPPEHQQCAYFEPPVPQSPKPQVCDAAIQTDDSSMNPTNSRSNSQKSIDENVNNNSRESIFKHRQSPVDQPIFVSKATFNTSGPKTQPSHAKPQEQQQQPVPQTPTTPGGSYIRTVPIFVEGRSEPVINSHKIIPNQPTEQPQWPSTAKSQQDRPIINTQQAYQPEHCGADNVPPQTPITANCIDKITNIQKDVLDLMQRVENFKGRKNDKEYMYLDEMLTRNLLKLDTIDTNGKESIRLARKEAIKCINASINVLETISEENAKKMDTDQNENVQETDSAQQNETFANDDAVHLIAGTVQSVDEENPNILNEQTVIPLPPPPEHPNDQLHSNIAIPLPPPANKETIQNQEDDVLNDNHSNSNIESGASSMVDVNLTSEGFVTPTESSESNVNAVTTKEGESIEEEKGSNEIFSSMKSRSPSPTKDANPTNEPESSSEQSPMVKKKVIKKIKKVIKKDVKDKPVDSVMTETPK